ncbi:MAG: YidC/Oxa1 family insertase periplasmic-domain containing protein [Thermoguttaceae bacterium]
MLSVALWVGYTALLAYLHPRPAQVAGPAGQDKPPGKEAGKEQPAAKPQAALKGPEKPAEGPAAQQPAKPGAKEPPETQPPGAKPAEAQPAAAAIGAKPPAGAEREKKVARQWLTLGSADPQDPYRMLVTLDNQGAALARIELSSPRYCDLEDRTGYLGHLVIDDDDPRPGCQVQVVGAGTPAAKAGLKPGDRIMAVGGHAIIGDSGLEGALAGTRPGQTVELGVRRGPQALTLSAQLIRRPLEIVRPEWKTPRMFQTTDRHVDAVQLDQDCPLSLLGTLEQIDEEKIPVDDDPAKFDLARELPGVELRASNWEVLESDQSHAVFRRTLAQRGLEITKTYRLAEVPAAYAASADFRAYHLEFEIQVHNIGGKAHDVAYRLDGPNGLPREGAWYASKVRGGADLRDTVYQPQHAELGMVTLADLEKDPAKPIAADRPFQFLGVDAQFFAAALIPTEEVSPQLDRAMALRVGSIDPQRKTLTNTSLRVISKTTKLEPGKALAHRFDLFAGPKRTPLLDEYQLGQLIYYGWFGWVAVPMTKTVDFFYLIVRNYGLAIILLTVLVRLCMFPLSRKQALNAQKMQELQPEIKRIQEKYKKDVEGRARAQKELFRKHKYNPLGGCLVLFIQLPVFIGLYRSLQVHVELRDAPLFSHAIRWCSNLAAPDMLFDWSRFMPDWFNSGSGMLSLGPYFNLLPLLTIGLFLWQQKMFMPPPADEQAAMQQKMMNFMMVFMGILFYKVAAGLCIYFIASSLWGIAERKFLPKMAVAGGDAGPATFDVRPANGDRNPARRRKGPGRK